MGWELIEYEEIKPNDLILIAQGDIENPEVRFTIAKCVSDEGGIHIQEFVFVEPNNSFSKIRILRGRQYLCPTERSFVVIQDNYDAIGERIKLLGLEVPELFLTCLSAHRELDGIEREFRRRFSDIRPRGEKGN